MHAGKNNVAASNARHPRNQPYQKRGNQIGDQKKDD